jgi:hypothetical protein
MSGDAAVFADLGGDLFELIGNANPRSPKLT